jgi:hypothetical protein
VIVTAGLIGFVIRTVVVAGFTDVTTRVVEQLVGIHAVKSHRSKGFTRYVPIIAPEPAFAIRAEDVGVVVPSIH